MQDKFSAWFRERMGRRYETQVEMAHAAGVHEVHISRLLTGERNPRSLKLETAVALANALGATLAELAVASGLRPREGIREPLDRELDDVRNRLTQRERELWLRMGRGLLQTREETALPVPRARRERDDAELAEQLAEVVRLAARDDPELVRQLAANLAAASEGAAQIVAQEGAQGGGAGIPNRRVGHN